MLHTRVQSTVHRNRYVDPIYIPAPADTRSMEPEPKTTTHIRIATPSEDEQWQFFTACYEAMPHAQRRQFWQQQTQASKVMALVRFAPATKR